MAGSGSDVSCFHPVPAMYHGADIIVRPQHRSDANISLPCGKCPGCKTSRAQEWAARVVHECRDHHASIFATLTYTDHHVDPDGALVPGHLSDFLRKLRKLVARGHDNIIANGDDTPFPNRLRYLACGEYGDRTGRPHYHALLFGIAFTDATAATSKLLNSPTLEKVWGRGTVNYGAVTAASAAYVAGYTVKSLGAQQHSVDGVVIPRPFLRCSRHPGIGARYADTYAADFRFGSLVVDGSHHRVPRYYRKRIAQTNAQLAEEISENILKRITGDPFGDPTHPQHPERLRAAELIHRRKQELTRSHSL